MMADRMDVASMPGLTDSDRENLALGDENFKPNTWEELKQTIGSVDLSHCLRLFPYACFLQLRMILGC